MTTRLARWMLSYQGKKIVTAYCNPSKYKLYNLSPVVIERIDIGFSYKCQIRFSNNRSGVKYIYTLDGSEPTLSNGTVIENDTIELGSNCTIKAIAVIESRYVIEISASVSSMSIADLKLPLVSFGLDKYDGFEIVNLLSADKQAHTITRAESGVWLSCSVSIPSVANKKLYQRLTYWGNRELTQTESYTRLSLVPRPDRGKGKAYSTQKTVISDIFMADTSSVNDYPFGYYLYDVTLESPLILNYEEGLLIDIGELEEAYPYFAELSINEQKEILDTLPFFQDRFEL